jgi:hypothetical protein
VRISPLLLAGLLLVSGCSEDKKAKEPEGERALREARGRLAVLAQATANGVYDATYRFVQKPSNHTGVIRIRQQPPQYRIDITARDSASFFSLTTGTVSCSQKVQKKKKAKTCFLVAKPGEAVPALFDPGVQRLFRDAVQDLASNPTDYTVTTTTPPSAPPTTSATPSGTPAPSRSAAPLPTGECFLVTRATEAPATQGFEDGTYCFAESGLATSIAVSSGTLTLTEVGGTPHPDAFKPTGIAKVQKLPELTSPKPTPSKK